MVNALDILEKLVENKLESVNTRYNYSFFGNNNFNKNFIFGEKCFVTYYDYREGIINLIVTYDRAEFEQDFKKNTPEHAKLILLFDKIRKYIVERDEQALLNYVNS